MSMDMALLEESIEAAKFIDGLINETAALSPRAKVRAQEFNAKFKSNIALSVNMALVANVEAQDALADHEPEKPVLVVEVPDQAPEAPVADVAKDPESEK